MDPPCVILPQVTNQLVVWKFTWKLHEFGTPPGGKVRHCHEQENSMLCCPCLTSRHGINTSVAGELHAFILPCLEVECQLISDSETLVDSAHS